MEFAVISNTMRISLIFFIASFFPGVTVVKAQSSQMLLPMQKLPAHKYILPEPQTAFLFSLPDSAKTLSPNNYLPLDFYSTHLGVMCKMELKLEKGTKLPLRIRLGSKDQVDYLEGKYRKH